MVETAIKGEVTVVESILQFFLMRKIFVRKWY